MFLRIFLVIVGLAVFVGALAGTKALQIKAMIAAGEAHVTPPETVTSAEATTQSWDNLLTAVASLRAAQGVTVSTESAGVVQSVSFESGAQVEAGALLVQLDTSVEVADLAAAKARLDLARLSATRQRELAATRSGTQSDLDSAEAGLSVAIADVARIEATIARKTIRAPFAGALGLRTVNPGQYLQPGTPIVSLQSLDKLHADFALPQQDLPSLSKGLKIRLQSDVHPDRAFVAELTAIEPLVSQTSRTLKVEATLDNADGALRPGMFVTAAVVLQKPSDVVAIPSSAVVYAPYGDSVFVIEKRTDEKTNESFLAVRKQVVRLGRTKGDLVAVTEGVKAGETIVSAGAFKLRNDTKVVVNNEVQPSADAAPKLPNN